MSDRAGALYEFDRFTLEGRSRRLLKDGRPLRLQPQPYLVLITLLEHHGSLVTRQALCARLWPDGTHVEFDASLNTAVRKLRSALGDSADRPRFIQTEPGRGYRFIGTLVSASRTLPDAVQVETTPTLPASAPISHWGAWQRLAYGCAALVALLIAPSTPERRSQDAVVRLAVAATTGGGGAVAERAAETLRTHLAALDENRLLVLAPRTGDDRRPHRHDATHDLFVEAAGSHLTVRVVRRSDGVQRWSHSFSAADDELPRIARQAGRAVVARLLGDDPAARLRASTIHADAWELFVAGERAASSASLTDHAAELFRAAAVRDPEFPEAWAWLAFTISEQVRAGTRDPDPGYLTARVAAERALALDDRLWRAHAALGRAKAAEGSAASEAAAAFARAIAAGGTDAWLYVAYSCALRDARGPGAALRAIEDGLTVHPRSAELLAHRGLYLHAVQRYDEEMMSLHAAAETDPLSAEAQFHLGLGFARRQRYSESLVALQRAASLSGGDPRFVSWLGRIAADAGRPAQARAAIEALERRAATRHVPRALIDSVQYHLAQRRG